MFTADIIAKEPANPEVVSATPTKLLSAADFFREMHQPSCGSQLPPFEPMDQLSLIGVLTGKPLAKVEAEKARIVFEHSDPVSYEVHMRERRKARSELIKEKSR